MPVNRSLWEDYISQKSRTSRLLFSKGNSYFSSAPSISATTTKDFLNKLNKAEADSKFLFGLYFYTQEKLRIFFVKELITLKKQLNKGNLKTKTTYHGKVKGSILWGNTLLERSRKSSEPLYVCKSNNSTNDLPENQLLKKFLIDSRVFLNELIKVNGTDSLPSEIMKIKHTIDSVLRDQTIKNLTEASSYDPLMIKRARRSKISGYSTLADIVQKFRSAILSKKIEVIHDLISNGWFSPIDDNDLFEIYVLVLVLDTLEKHLGEPVSYGLLTKKRQEVASFKSQKYGLDVFVYYDQSPDTILGKKSNYINVMDRYSGLSGTPRRPDITIRFSRPGKEDVFFIVEVKRSDDSGYKNESVYKSFSYIKDFEYLWEHEKKQVPKIALFFPEKNVMPYSSNKDIDELEIFSEVDIVRFENVILDRFINLETI